MRQARQNQAGFSLIELMISSAIMVMVIGTVYMMMGEGLDAINNLKTHTELRDEAREGISALAKDLIESDVDKIDTMYRFDVPASGYYYGYNHFYTSTSSFSKQCPNWQCPWAYDANAGDYRYPRSHTTANYYFSDNIPAGTVFHGGKNYPSKYTEDTCKYDGSVLLTYQNLDGIKISSARDIYDNFVTWESETVGPDTQSLIFYYPYRNPRKDELELRRYQVYVSDIFPAWNEEVQADGSTRLAYNPAGTFTNPNLATAGNQVYQWGADTLPEWETLNPATMAGEIDGKPNFNMLMDFDNDGRVSIVPGETDADSYDYFYVYMDQTGSGYFYLYKYSAVPNRYFYLFVQLEDGQSYCYVNLQSMDDPTVYFNNYAWFIRPTYSDPDLKSVGAYQVAAQHVIDIDCSTVDSNPISANPAGMTDEDAVRITLVTGTATDAAGYKTDLEAIESTLIYPRNTAVE